MKKNTLLYLTINLFAFSGMISCASRYQNAGVEKTKDEKQILTSAQKHSHQDHLFLVGKWYGEVMTNSSDPSGGGQPTLGETGTQLQINLFEADASIEGSLTIGQVEEQWRFFNEQHIWSDGKIKVHTQEVNVDNIPNWIKERLLSMKYDEIILYKFLSCQKMNSEKPCEVKKDLPLGIIQNGVWVFMTQGSDLYVNVYYTYPSGGRRILEQKLSKR